MADPERFDVDPDPTFHAEAAPDPAPDLDQYPNFLAWMRKNISSKSSTIVSKILQKLSCVIFSVKMRKEG